MVIFHSYVSLPEGTDSLSLYTYAGWYIDAAGADHADEHSVAPTNQGRHAAPKVSSNLEDQRSSARSYTLQIVVPPSLPDLIVDFGPL